LCGYPPEDLLGKTHFVDECTRALDRVAAASSVPALVGTVAPDGRSLHNSLALCHGGRVERLYHKRRLPNYSVFDEERYFEPGDQDAVLALGDARVALTICEDIWDPDVVHRLAQAGARIILNASASPFHAAKGIDRERMLISNARSNEVWIAYCNLVGGQDELVFDGRSTLISPKGEVIARARAFAEDLLVVDINFDTGTAVGVTEPMLEGDAETYEALTLGVRDYASKNGFSDVVIGLSGGIDSALTATIATDALGSEHVHGVLMPSRYSSEGSVADARALADSLGINALELPIDEPFDSMLSVLSGSFARREPDVTEENLQARVRGALLMALSNKFGWLVLATGNKSELSVGYSTLYGDMVGGFAPLKDVFKTRVWDLARWRNTRSAVIPAASIEKVPSAELRPDQTDQDSLPPYEVLDTILQGYVENDLSSEDIAAMGFDEETVRDVVRMVDGAEYKRRQGPPGCKVTPKAFGKDRRMPITNRFGG
jgi:NAD+ synthase (glutamine-hydrolysing)